MPKLTENPDSCIVMFFAVFFQVLKDNNLHLLIPIYLLTRTALFLSKEYNMYTGSITDHLKYSSVGVSSLLVWVFRDKISRTPLAVVFLFHMLVFILEYIPAYLTVRSALTHLVELRAYEELPVLINTAVYLGKRTYYHYSNKPTSSSSRSSRSESFIINELMESLFALFQWAAYVYRFDRCARKSDTCGVIMVIGDMLAFSCTLIARFNKDVILDTFLVELSKCALSNTFAYTIDCFTFLGRNVLNVRGLYAYLTGPSVGIVQQLIDVTSYCISWHLTFMKIMSAARAQKILKTIGRCHLTCCCITHIIVQIVRVKYLGYPDILAPEIVVSTILGVLCISEIAHR